MNTISYAVDEIITDLGYYSPLELLLRQGCLRYSDYERWRSGEVDFICETFVSTPKHIVGLLESARDYVQALGFSAETYHLFGWHGKKANVRLDFCRTNNAISSDILSTQYLRKEDQPQMDLFFDNRAVQLANGVIQALGSRNVKNSVEKLRQLEQHDAEHLLCEQGAELLSAVQKLQQKKSIYDVRQELNYLQQRLAPLAKNVLKGQARDFMSPFWRRLALALGTGFFDEQYPDLNAAYCYAQVLLWSEVVNSIRNIAQWQQHATLFAQLSHACYQNKQRIESIQILCDYCWLYSDQDGFPPDDNKSVIARNKFMDLELDEKWGWQQFPAWLLLNEPGLAKHIQASPSTTACAFKALQQLLLAEQEKNTLKVDLRLQLQTAHKGLFDYFLKRQA